MHITENLSAEEKKAFTQTLEVDGYTLTTSIIPSALQAQKEEFHSVVLDLGTPHAITIPNRQVCQLLLQFCWFCCELLFAFLRLLPMLS